MCIRDSVLTPYLDQSIDVDGAEFSPDGLFIAYSVLSAGQARVSVSPFDGSGRITLNYEYILQSWTSDGKGLVLLDPVSNALIMVELETSDRIRWLGEPQVLYQSERLLGGHMLSDRSLMMYESDDIDLKGNRLEVITNASVFLQSLAPPTQ